MIFQVVLGVHVVTAMTFVFKLLLLLLLLIFAILHKTVVDD
jgi:hypothetical protein